MRTHPGRDFGLIASEHSAKKVSSFHFALISQERGYPAIAELQDAAEKGSG
jgi:hypothetical protein